MDKHHLAELLRKVKTGEIGETEALKTLQDYPVLELEYASLDTHRSVRQGFPEVVFGLGKTPAQTLGILSKLSEHNSVILTTKLPDESLQLLKDKFPGAIFYDSAKAMILRRPGYTPPVYQGIVTVVSAGTSDMPVVEEAAATLDAMNVNHRTVHDVGVAGIHRVLKHKDTLNEAAVVIVVAGMEGALASIVAGLTDSPVIAVPTSVGYGASFSGLAALLGMLNSCASGVMVTNIDNGFGAASAAAKIIFKMNKLYQAE